MRIIKDKLRIVASLTAEEIEHIKVLYPSKRRNPYFKYCYYQRKPHFFAVWLLPMKGYIYRYFNAMLSFNPANPPIEALEIFNMIEPDRWKVSRVDIAFDFLTPYKNCFLLPPPTNLQINRYNTTLYYGAVRSACTVCQYNKQKQLKEVHGVDSVPLTRIEFRANTRELKGFRCLLKSLTNGKRDWKKLVRKEREEVSAAVKERTNDMLKLFLDYIEGDIDSFMLDGLTSPSPKFEPLQAV